MAEIIIFVAVVSGVLLLGGVLAKLNSKRIVLKDDSEESVVRKTVVTMPAIAAAGVGKFLVDAAANVGDDDSPERHEFIINGGLMVFEVESTKAASERWRGRW